MVQVDVARLGLDSATNSYVVILQERGGARLLPIWIGQPEAESIVMQMHGVKRARPLTHDLCRSLIEGLGATLRRVQITRVEKSTYFAELLLEHPGGLVRIDARPSDSIAIALRLDAPVFADGSLLAMVEEDGEEEGVGSEQSDAPSFGTPFEVESEGSPHEEPRAGGTEESPSPRKGDRELTARQLQEYLENLRPEDFGKFKP